MHINSSPANSNAKVTDVLYSYDFMDINNLEMLLNIKFFYYLRR